MVAVFFAYITIRNINVHRAVALVSIFRRLGGQLIASAQGIVYLWTAVLYIVLASISELTNLHFFSYWYFMVLFLVYLSFLDTEWETVEKFEVPYCSCCVPQLGGRCTSTTSMVYFHKSHQNALELCISSYFYVLPYFEIFYLYFVYCSSTFFSFYLHYFNCIIILWVS